MSKEDPERPRSQEVKRFLQEALLRSYPNPDREGCGGSVILKEMAEREFPHEHPFWDTHVSHCSPCYREFLEFRNRERARESRSQNVTRATIAALVGVIVIGGLYLFLRSPSSQSGRAGESASLQPPLQTAQSTQPAVLNLESESITRSIQSAPNVGGEVQRIPRGRLDLSIYLPTGSERGEYEVQLLREISETTPLASASGTARIEKGLTVLTLSPDFSRMGEGTYILAIRRVRGEWRYYRIRLV
jgi:hypothetical protein